MAKFTIERWGCDRCGSHSDKWLKPGSAYEVRASVDYGTAGGSLIEWREMCVECNDVVSKEIDAMHKSAATARQATPDA